MNKLCIALGHSDLEDSMYCTRIGCNHYTDLSIIDDQNRNQKYEKINMTQSLRPSKQKPKLKGKEAWLYWLNSWRWSNIKKMWTVEYSRVYHGTNMRLQQINDKLGKK